MPMDPEVRRQILIGIQASGADVPTKLAQEIARLGIEVKNATSAFGAAKGGTQEWASEITALQGQINKLNQLLGEVTGNTKAASKERQKAIEDEEAAYVRAVKTYERAKKQMEDAAARQAAASIKSAEREVSDEEAAYVRAQLAYAKAKKQMEDAAEKQAASAKRAADKAAEDEEAAYVRATIAYLKAEKQLEEGAQKRAAQHATDAARRQQEDDDYYVTYTRLTAQAAAITEKEEKRKRDAFVQTTLATQRQIDGIEVSTSRYVQASGQGVQSTNKFGYAMLNLSHAIQDAQYGFGAVLNNIPLIVTSMGGGPGLAGTIMAVGVAMNLLPFHKWLEDWGIVRDRVAYTGNSLDLVKEKLKGVTESPWLIEVDYRSIVDLEEKIRDLEKRKAALEATRADIGTPELKKEGEAFVKSVDSSKLTGMIQGAHQTLGRSAADVQDTQAAEFHRKLYGGFKRQAEDPNTSWVARQIAWGMASHHGHEAVQAENRIRSTEEDYASKITAGVALGEESSMKNLAELMKMAPGAFSPESRKGFMGIPGYAGTGVTKTKDDWAQRMEEEGAIERDQAENKRRFDAHHQTLRQKEAEEKREVKARQATALALQLANDAANVKEETERDRQDAKGARNAARDVKRAEAKDHRDDVAFAHRLGRDQLGSEAEMRALELQSMGRNPQEIQAQLSQDAAARIRQINPGIGRRQAQQMGSEMATEATQKLQSDMMNSMERTGNFQQSQMEVLREIQSQLMHFKQKQEAMESQLRATAIRGQRLGMAQPTLLGTLIG